MTAADAAGAGPARPVSVYVTVGSDEAARTLARQLVEERLVACVNLYPVRSVFRWEGEVQEETEVALWAKTVEDRVHALMERVVELHPYDVPCVEVFPVVGGHVPFCDWVQAETRPSEA